MVKKHTFYKKTLFTKKCGKKTLFTKKCGKKSYKMKILRTYYV